MASTGRAAPSSPGPRHSSPPKPPSLPPSDKTGFQHGAEGAAGSWAAPAALGSLGTRAASSPVLLRVWALRPRPPPRVLSASLRGEVGTGRWTGGIRVITAIRRWLWGGFSPVCCRWWCSAWPQGCTGRAEAAMVSAACKFRAGEHLSRKAAHRSQALCRVLARAERVPPGSQALSGADECVCDSPVPSGELGVPVTHRSSSRGCQGNARQL